MGSVDERLVHSGWVVGEVPSEGEAPVEGEAATEETVGPRSSSTTSLRAAP